MVICEGVLRWNLTIELFPILAINMKLKITDVLKVIILSHAEIRSFIDTICRFFQKVIYLWLTLSVPSFLGTFLITNENIN